MDYLVADNSLSLLFLVFPHAHSERISKEGQKEENSVHKAFFSVVLLSGDIN